MPQMKKFIPVSALILSVAFLIVLIGVLTRSASSTRPKGMRPESALHSQIATTQTSHDQPSIPPKNAIYDNRQLVLPRAVSTSKAETGSAPHETHVAIRNFESELFRWTDGADSRARDLEPTDTDALRFAALFRALPQKGKLTALHRACNLLPSRNTHLLSALALDKSEPSDVLHAAFSELANRDRALAKPILKEIAKDKAHPCSRDAEWIFKVIGEPIEP